MAHVTHLRLHGFARCIVPRGVFFSKAFFDVAEVLSDVFPLVTCVASILADGAHNGEGTPTQELLDVKSLDMQSPAVLEARTQSFRLNGCLIACQVPLA